MIAAAVKTVPAAITASARRKTNAAMTVPAGANKICRNVFFRSGCTFGIKAVILAGSVNL